MVGVNIKKSIAVSYPPVTLKVKNGFTKCTFMQVSVIHVCTTIILVIERYVVTEHIRLVSVQVFVRT